MKLMPKKGLRINFWGTTGLFLFSTIFFPVGSLVLKDYQGALRGFESLLIVDIFIIPFIFES